MNLEHFIARRLAFNRSGSFTRVIIGIAIAAIALSMAIMIVSTAMISGFKYEINSKIFGFWGHIHITDASINRNFELKAIKTDDAYIKEIKNIKFVEYQKPRSVLGFNIEGKFSDERTIGGIKHVQPFIVLPGLIETKDGFQAILFKGIDESFDWPGMQRFLVQGRGINYQGDSLNNEMVISKIIADKLQIKLNQKIITSFIKEGSKLKRVFKIVGIYNTGLEEYDRRIVIGEMTKIHDLLGWEKNDASGLEIFLDDIRDNEILTDYIYTNLLPANLYAETIQSKFPNIFEWLKLQDINERVILQLMTLVAIINMVTVLLILILERTHMIGVLKSLGASNGSVRKIFLYHAAYMVFFGQLIGNIVGISLCYAQKYTGFIKLDETNYYLSEAPILMDWSTILLINLAAFGIIVVFLTLPSLLVKKITPIKALRFD